MPEEPLPTFYVPTPEEVGAYLPDYQIEGILGYGGMGAVYKAHQTFFNRDVAIKLLLSKTFGEEEFYRQYLAEAQSMSVLDHKYLLKIYDYGEVVGIPFIIIEYVHGLELYEAIGAEGAEPLSTAQVMMRVCEGMAHAHEANILHRDLKPENILIDAYANPKIADFGLARDKHDPVKDKVIWGSPGYIAPEVIHDPDRVDHRADIYALGCVMYFMLTGQIPNPNDTDYKKFDSLDPRFRQILNRSMNPFIEKRYLTAGAMGEAFRDLIMSLDEKGSNGMIASAPVN